MDMHTTLKRWSPLGLFGTRGGWQVLETIGLLIQVRLNDFQSTPRPPKGGTPGFSFAERLMIW